MGTKQAYLRVQGEAVAPELVVPFTENEKVGQPPRFVKWAGRPILFQFGNGHKTSLLARSRGSGGPRARCAIYRKRKGGPAPAIRKVGRAADPVPIWEWAQNKLTCAFKGKRWPPSSLCHLQKTKRWASPRDS